MSQEKFYDKRDKEIVEISTDYFNCGVCFFDEFVFSPNPDFLSGASAMKYIQGCKNCGNTILADKNTYSSEVSRYMPFDQYRDMEERRRERDLEKAKHKEKVGKKKK
jgi:transcription elongation factor Elf1